MKKQQQPQSQISARVPTAVLSELERVAEIERRPVGSLVRIIISDWAQARQAQQQGRAA